MDCSTPGFPVHHQLLEFTQSRVHRVSDAIHPSHPRSSPSPPAPNPSQHQSLFQWVNLHMRWPKYWSFSFSIIPSKEHPGLISFRMDCLYLLAVQGTLKRVFSNTTVQKHQFFSAQLSSQSNITTGKTIALTRQTFVGKVMSLLLNMLSRLVITFLLRSKRLLISGLKSPSAVILEPRKIKSATVSPSISHEVMGPVAMIFVFWMLSFQPTFSLSSFTFKRLFSSSLSAISLLMPKSGEPGMVPVTCTFWNIWRSWGKRSCQRGRPGVFLSEVPRAYDSLLFRLLSVLFAKEWAEKKQMKPKRPVPVTYTFNSPSISPSHLSFSHSICLLCSPLYSSPPATQ